MQFLFEFFSVILILKLRSFLLSFLHPFVFLYSSSLPVVGTDKSVEAPPGVSDFASTVPRHVAVSADDPRRIERPLGALRTA